MLIDWNKEVTTPQPEITIVESDGEGLAAVYDDMRNLAFVCSKQDVRGVKILANHLQLRVRCQKLEFPKESLGFAPAAKLKDA